MVAVAPSRVVRPPLDVAGGKPVSACRAIRWRMSVCSPSRDGWLELGDRIWVRRYETADETCAVIGSARGLVAVDTRLSHRHADELLADIATSSRQPVIAAVNTHGHWDHAFGNARFSQLPIWGHVTARRSWPRRARRWWLGC